MTQIVDMAAFRGPTAQMVDLSKFTFWGPPQDMDFFYKQSTRTGRAWLRSIRGRTVSYNQLVQNGDFSAGPSRWQTSGATISAAGGVATWTASNATISNNLNTQILFINGHTYCISFCIKGNADNVVSGAFGTVSGGGDWTSENYSTAWKRVTKIATPTTNTSDRLYIRPNMAGKEDAVVNFKDIIIVDLTQAGLDSIITTPGQFEAWQMEQFGHKGYLGDTPGKLVNVNPTGVKTTTPGGDEYTLPLDFTERFPTGMNGVNGIYDEVVSDENGKFMDGDVRYGKVDLGDLTWTKLASKNVFMASLADAKPAATNYTKANLICPNYYTDASGSVESNSDGIGINTSKLITIGDNRYTDAATFKAAMAGVPLIFELATPQHVSFTDPSDAVYPVTEGGTEQVLPVNGSEPTTGPLLGKVSYKQGRSAQ